MSAAGGVASVRAWGRPLKKPAAHQEGARAEEMHGCELLYPEEEARRVCALLTAVLGYSPCAEGSRHPLLPADAGSVLVVSAGPVDAQVGAA